MSFSTTGEKILTGSFDHTVTVWDAACGKYVAGCMPAVEDNPSLQNRQLHTLIGHRGEIANALFSYDNSIIATGSMDKTCKIWDTRTGTVIETLR